MPKKLCDSKVAYAVYLPIKILTFPLFVLYVLINGSIYAIKNDIPSKGSYLLGIFLGGCYILTLMLRSRTYTEYLISVDELCEEIKKNRKRALTRALFFRIFINR